MALMMDIAMFMESINVLLLLGLLYIYSQNYRQIKAKFSLGLIFFALFFLVENILTLYFNITFMQVYLIIELPTLILHTIQTVGFSILLFITWKD